MCSDVSACSDSYGVVLSPAETLFDIPRQTPVVDVLADGLWHGDGPRIRCHHALRWRDWMVHLCTKKKTDYSVRRATPFLCLFAFAVFH